MYMGKCIKSQGSLIGWWRNSSWSQGTTTAAVVGFFLWAQLWPSIAGAKELVEKAKQEHAAQIAKRDPLNDTLKSFKTTLTNVDSALSNKAKRKDAKSPSDHKASLKALRGQLVQADKEVTAGFQRDLDHINAHHLGDVIKQRHAAALAKYRASHKQMLANLDQIDQAKDDASLLAEVKETRDWLGKQQVEKRQQPFDPKNLPFRIAEDKIRQPKTHAKDLKTILKGGRTTSKENALPTRDRKRPAIKRELTLLNAETSLTTYLAMAQGREEIELASNGSTSGLMVAKDLQQCMQNLFPGQGYCDETEDAQFLPADAPGVAAQAAALGHDPVAIFNWVHDNVDFEPTYGSIQGAERTYQTRRGNAFDTASLLVALLRANGIPARYVYGTVQIPSAKLMNLVGGVTSPDAAQNLLGQGGIPNVGLVSGGNVVAVQLEHVWVEAYVDFYPSRGAKNLAPDTWVPMDASFKQYTTIQPMYTASDLGDPLTIAQAYAQSATLGSDGSSASRFDLSSVQNSIEAFRATLQQRADQGTLTNGLDDVIGGRRIASLNTSVLQSSLPYLVVARGDSTPSVGANMRATMQIELMDDSGTPLLNVSRDLPTLGLNSVNLSHPPATADDANAWNSYEGAQDFAAYTVHVKSSLTIGGELIAQSAALDLGRGLSLRVTLRTPSNQNSAEFSLSSGDEVEIGVNGAELSPRAPLRFFQGRDLSSAADNLSAESKSFWAQTDAWSGLLGKLHHVVAVRLPSVGIFAAPITVSYAYGTPNRAYYNSRLTDVKLAQTAAVNMGGDNSKLAAFMQQSGVVLSSFEGLAEELTFHHPIGKGSNTARLLEVANREGIPIHRVTSQNASAQLGLLSQHSAAVLDDIANATSAGFEVIIPETPLTNASWTGSGYIIQDPVTGSADYRISGGASGNSVTECARQTVPVRVKAPDVSPVALYVSSLLADNDFNLNVVGVAAAVVTVALVIALIVEVGPLLAVAARVGMSFVGRAASIAVMTMFGAGEALADDDGCSGCQPQFLGFRYGGQSVYTQRHNQCADLYTDRPGSDVRVEKRNFDGLIESQRNLYEIKTGTFYTTLDNIKDTVPYARDLQDALLFKAAFEYQYDAELAFSCKYNYRYGVRDTALYRDLSGAVGFGGVFMNGCQ